MPLSRMVFWFWICNSCINQHMAIINWSCSRRSNDAIISAKVSTNNFNNNQGWSSFFEPILGGVQEVLNVILDALGGAWNVKLERGGVLITSFPPPPPPHQNLPSVTQCWKFMNFKVSVDSMNMTLSYFYHNEKFIIILNLKFQIISIFRPIWYPGSNYFIIITTFCTFKTLLYHFMLQFEMHFRRMKHLLHCDLS